MNTEKKLEPLREFLDNIWTWTVIKLRVRNRFYDRLQNGLLA
jgi:hypothetical protein